MTSYFYPKQFCLQTVKSIAQDVKKMKPSCTAGGKIKWCRQFGKQVGSASKMFNIEFTTCDPTVELECQYEENSKSCRMNCYSVNVQR